MWYWKEYVHEGSGGGHFRVDKSLGKLKERFYWPGHYNDIHNWCSTCSDCVARKTGGKDPCSLLLLDIQCKSYYVGEEYHFSIISRRVA